MNTWFVTIKDKEGVEAKFQQRGPANEAESRHAAMRDLIGAPTQRALMSGADDPKLEIVKIEMGPDDGDAPVGGWIPESARPVDLNRYANKDDHGNPYTIANPPPAKPAKK